MARRPRRVRRLIAAGVRAVVQRVRTAVWLHVGLVGPRWQRQREGGGAADFHGQCESVVGAHW